MVSNKLERIYTIPLRRDFVKVPKYYRAKRAMSYIKKYIQKHMKYDDVRVGPVLNEYVWERGITNPPGKVTVKAVKQDTFVTVELQGHEYKVKEVQTEKTEKPTSFKDKLAAKLQSKSEEEPKAEESVKESKDASSEKEAKQETVSVKKEQKADVSDFEKKEEQKPKTVENKDK